MLERYILIALIIIVFWLTGFVVYLVISDRERDLENELQEVSDMLGDEGTQ